MTRHETYMQRCLQLATNGLGTTYPNPLVGSVIVDQHDQIIGEGWHRKSGEPHAEVLAVAHARKQGYDKKAFAKATLYVNLEPCSHTGKTPPCANMIVANGFKKVVIGTLDPHDKVAGRGVRLLQENGISTTVGVIEDQCNLVNKRFFTYHKKQRPYIILKWAQSLDGYIAPLHKKEKSPVWISNTWSRQRTHQLRACEQGILVGANTIISDNPTLTTRDWYGSHPKRFIWSNGKELPKSHHIFNKKASTDIIVASEAAQVVHQLYKYQLQSVIIEGGYNSLQAFIDQDLWDEAHIYQSPTTVLKNGISAPQITRQYKQAGQYNLKDNQLTIIKAL